MTLINPEEFDALTRQDFQVFAERVFAELNPGIPYADNFHISLIAEALERVRRGLCRRLIVNVPPRSLKSHLVSITFPAWLHGHNPGCKIITASYGQELAEDLARETRTILQSAWYQTLFPRTRIDPARSAVHALETTAGGVRRATSVGGPMTGFGGDFVFIDDPTKPEEAHSETERAKANRWFRNTAFSRQNNKMTAAIVIVQQRLHEDDLTGHVLELDDWEVLSFPAIAQEDEVHFVKTPHGSYVHCRSEGEALHPEREPLAVLQKLERVLGVEHFSAQYLQTPTPPGGGLVKLDWFRSYQPDELPPQFEQIVQSWDTAQKAKALSDPSVCTTWGIYKGKVYLLDVVRLWMEYPELKRAIIAQARHHQASLVLIEDKASGISVLQDLKRDGLRQVQGVEPKSDKVMRLRAQTSVIENGFVYLPASASWRDTYLRELMTFPKARHDDQVDSTSQFLEWFNWQPAEPSIITYYRYESEGWPDERSPVTRLTNSCGINMCTGIEGTEYWVKADGFLHITNPEDVTILLRNPDWRRAREGEVALQGSYVALNGCWPGEEV